MIYDKIKKTSLAMRKVGDPMAATLVYYLSGLQAIAKENDGKITDDQTIAFLKNAVKKLEANVYPNPIEIDLLKQFLPKMVDTETVMAYIDTLDCETKGEKLKAVRTKFGALVDMKTISNLL